MSSGKKRSIKAAELRPLEMFLLGLVSDGLVTPYEWLARAQISLGASLPAVRRLRDAGLVKEAAAGPRGRREFSLTKAGKKQLADLDEYIYRQAESLTGDLESEIRLASLAQMSGKDEIARKLLLRASQAHSDRAHAATERINIFDPRSALVAAYTDMLNCCEAARESAIAESLRKLVTIDGTIMSRIIGRSEETLDLPSKVSQKAR